MLRTRSSGVPFFATMPNLSPKDLTSRDIVRRISIIDDSDTRSFLSGLITLDKRTRLFAASAALSPFFTRTRKTILVEHQQNKVFMLQPQAFFNVVLFQEIGSKSDVVRLTNSTVNTPDDIIHDSVAVVSIVVEKHFAPRDPGDRLGILNGRAVPMDLDRFFYPAEPIFLLHIRKTHQIRIRMECHGVSLSTAVQVIHVKLTPPDAERQELDVIESHSFEDGFEVLALLDPSRMHSKKLCSLTPDSGYQNKRYVHLLVEIKFSVDPSNNTFVILKGTLICRVVSDNVEFPKRNFDEQHKRSEARLPSWMHRSVFGASFVLDSVPYIA